MNTSEFHYAVLYPVAFECIRSTHTNFARSLKSITTSTSSVC